MTATAYDSSTTGGKSTTNPIYTPLLPCLQSPILRTQPRCTLSRATLCGLTMSTILSEWSVGKSPERSNHIHAEEILHPGCNPTHSNRQDPGGEFRVHRMSVQGSMLDSYIMRNYKCPLRCSSCLIICWAWRNGVPHMRSVPSNPAATIGTGTIDTDLVLAVYMRPDEYGVRGPCLHRRTQMKMGMA